MNKTDDLSTFLDFCEWVKLESSVEVCKWRLRVLVLKSRFDFFNVVKQWTGRSFVKCRTKGFVKSSINKARIYTRFISNTHFSSYGTNCRVVQLQFNKTMKPSTHLVFQFFQIHSKRVPLILNWKRNHLYCNYSLFNYTKVSPKQIQFPSENTFLFLTGNRTFNWLSEP